MGSAGSRNRSKHEHGRPRLCKVARVCVQLPCERFRGCFNAFELDEPSDSGEASEPVAVPVHPRRALFWGRERGGGRSRSCNWSAVHSKLVRGAHLEREQQSHSHSLNEPLSSTAQRLLFSPPQDSPDSDAPPRLSDSRTAPYSAASRPAPVRAVRGRVSNQLRSCLNGTSHKDRSSGQLSDLSCLRIPTPITRPPQSLAVWKTRSCHRRQGRSSS